eukprot:4911185-Amphidinium_carterae.1
MLGLVSERLRMEFVCLGFNSGGVELALSSGHAQRQCGFALTTKAEALRHEGAIPGSASRLTMADITISFGHGLRGLLPGIPGTIGLLSLWENALEGHLPQLHMNHTSTLLVYGNDFSCKLPRHYGMKLASTLPSTASLSLIGNHFTQPQCVPGWIMPTEQPTDIDPAEKKGLAHV